MILNRLLPASFVAFMSPFILGCPAAAQISVVDDHGNEVTLGEPARRIISLAPHITENLFAAGAGDLIIATVRFSNYPDAANDIPVIGSYKEISFESLVKFNPDLIIAWPSGNGDEMIRRLKNLGLKVYLDEPESLENIADSLERFGVLTANESHAEQSAGIFRSQLNVLQSKYGTASPVSVFYQVWDEPLTTLNRDNLISRIIELCGGTNVFAELTPLAPVISAESVLTANPQVIVASGMGDEHPDWLNDWKQWPALHAAENDQLYFIPPDIIQRNSPRIIEGAKLMCEYLALARSDQE